MLFNLVVPWLVFFFSEKSVAPVFILSINICHVWFVQDAKKDETVRKSYKYLAALHEVCHCLSVHHILLYPWWLSTTNVFIILRSSVELQSANPNHWRHRYNPERDSRSRGAGRIYNSTAAVLIAVLHENRMKSQIVVQPGKSCRM